MIIVIIIIIYYCVDTDLLNHVCNRLFPASYQFKAKMETIGNFYPGTLTVRLAFKKRMK